MARLLVSLSLWLMVEAAVHAYWLTPTRAEIIKSRAEFYIEEDSVRLNLFAAKEDLDKFAKLLSGKDSQVEEFFQNSLHLSTDFQDKIMGRVVKTGDWKTLFPELAASQAQTSRRRIEYAKYIEVRFSFNKTPTRVDISPLTYNKEVHKLGMICFHLSLPVIEVQPLVQKERVILDWRDPWKSRFTNKKWVKYPETPAISFLYIENKEVRHEIIVRPIDLKPWLEVDWIDKPLWGLNLRQQIKDDVSRFLMKHSEIAIDGVKTPFDISQVDFMQLTSRGANPVDELELLRPKGVLLGVILTSQRRNWPQEVKLDWKLFGETIHEVAAKVADDVQEVSRTLKKGNNQLQWVAATNKKMDNFSGGVSSKSSLAESLIRFSGFGGMREDKLKGVLQALLRRIYGAFDYRNENDIYDSLAECVEGDLLQRIYLEIKEALTVQNKEGLRVRVNAVEILAAQTVDSFSGGYIVETKWNVSGSVGHWGHVHRRTNQYRAKLKIQAADSVWKLLELELIDEERL
ncbi:MAG: hypothetical protein AAGA18_05020 [Verrucomicrobiota bacterium]